MLTLRSWTSSLVASIVAALSCLDGLLLCSSHMAVLAEAPQVIWDVRAIGKDVVHLIRPSTTEHATPAVALKDREPDLLPVLRELLTAPGLPTPRQQYAPATTRQ